MIYEDVVECEGCGATITHLVCGRLDTTSDPDYYLCESCVDERDASGEDDSAEPSIDDSVNFCPNCERPQQFGGLCSQCEHEADEEGQRYQDEGEARAHLNGSWG